MTKFLEKGDTVLRPLELSDAEFVRDLYNDPDIRQFLGRVPKPHSVDQAEERIRSLVESDDTVDFIIEKEGEPVGRIMLFDLDETYRHAEFGAFMVDPDRHGEGIGMKAAEMLIDYAFNQLNLHRVAGGYLEGNEASRKVQERLGFSEEGRLRDYKYRDGEYIDLVQMSVLEEEWR